MGLFKKKMEAIKRVKMAETHEIICLHCFRNFDHDKVFFRLGEGEIINPSELKERAKSFHQGILSAVTIAGSDPTTQRICPYCTNTIAGGAGFAPSTYIALVGAGDVVDFFTRMMRVLKGQTSRQFPLFCTNPTPDGIQHPASMVFTFSFADDTLPEIHIAYYDVTRGNEEKYAAFIRNASGVMLLIEPAQFAALEHEAPWEEPTDTLARRVEAHVYKQASGVSNIPTAVVLTNSFALRQSPAAGEYLPADSTLFTDFSHTQVFDLGVHDAVDAELDAFFQEIDPNFANALKRRFVELGFFAVQAGEETRRVDEPFLWLLYKLGYIEGVSA